MRLLTMLLASLVLHLVVAGGIALSCLQAGSKAHPAGRAPVAVTRMILMRSSEAPWPKSLGRAPASSASHVTPPAPVSPSLQNTLALIAPKPAPEANPNAHLPAPSPETVLDPTPPPILDSASGVVFVLDVSGSMYEPYAGSTRLNCARQVLSERMRALKNGTPFAIVLYAQKARASGPLVAANDATREAALRFVEREVDCGGGTDLPEGLAAAERLHTGDVVLLSDGDLNTTVQNLSIRAREILGDAKQGPNLEVFGIAPRSTENAEQLLQTLAADQGGTYQVEQSEGDTGLLSSRKLVPGAR